MKRFCHDLVQHRTLWLMILPTLIFFLIFSYLPMTGIYFAFTEYKFQLGYFGSPFVGLKNFEFLFKSGILGSLTVNTVLYNLAFIFFQNLCQVVCAIFLNDLRSRRFVRITQTLIFLPYFISMVLVGVFAYNLLNIDNGILNTLFRSFGMESFNFYMTPGVWPLIIIFAHVWKGLGYGTVIYLSSLTSINPEYYETARIDGATKWQQIRYITLPMLMPTIALLMMFSLGGIMKGQFELFYQLVGRNGVLYAATDIIDTYVYRSLMVNFNIGMGTAAGLYQSVFGFVFVMAVNWLMRRLEPSYALF
jgi:putative aldouronate transport system permease protein